MDSTATLRFRRNAAQRQALAPLEREIRATDPHGQRKYIRDFTSAFRSYQSVLEPTELDAAYAQADLLLVGDYHALPQSQRFAASLVRQLALERPVVVALEPVFARDQELLDAWSRGELGESELRERLRFDLYWGYDWKPFRELLETARLCHAPVFALDCMPRNDLRRIKIRDRHAAERIAEIRQRHPEAAILVLFGESHLAPDHLPARLRQRMPRERMLTVLQNVDPLYWRAAGERRERVDAVRVTADVVCVFNATPLEKYESYRLCIERWQQDSPQPPDLAPAFYHLVDGLLRFLNVDKDAPSTGARPRFHLDLLPEVHVRPGAARVRRMLRRKSVGESEASGILHQLAEQGCCYVPALGAVLIENFQFNHAAEAAARSVHHICAGSLLADNASMDPAAVEADPEVRFYAALLHFALADFGARTLCPARPAVRASDLRVLYKQPELLRMLQLGSLRSFTRLVDLLLYLESDTGLSLRPPAEPLAELARLGPGPSLYAARVLGQRLGSRLYDAYLAGQITKRPLRALFFRSLAPPGTARRLYFSLERRLRGSTHLRQARWQSDPVLI